MIEAFIFDLDGTLLDSEILWVEAYIELLRRHGLAFSREDALAVVYGKSFGNVHAETLRRFSNLTWSGEEMVGKFRAVFQELVRKQDLRIHSSIELLERLARQYPIGLVSGSSRADVEEGIRMAGIGSHLRFALSSEDYAPGKPNPAGFLLAARKLGVSPSHCLVFEDSAVGVKAAKSAGMFCVALARPGRPDQDFSQADLVLADLAEFPVNDLPGLVPRRSPNRRKARGLPEG